MATKELAVYINRHYQTVRVNSLGTKTEDYIPVKKINFLIVGPTGSGKTASINYIARKLDVPFFEGDSTSFTKTGYIGDSVTSMIEGLLKTSSYDVKKAERGIIFIDEIDKIAAKECATRRDIAGSDVQAELLKLIEGKEVIIKQKTELSEVSYTINTKDILFIGGRAFTELSKKKGQKYSLEDFIKIGFKPEILGRFGKIIYFEGPTKDKLHRILQAPKVSPLKEAQRLMKAGYDIKIGFSKKNLEASVERALRLNMGARGLNSSINAVLGNFIIDSDELEGQTVTVTEEMVKTSFQDEIVEKEPETWRNMYS